MRVIEFRGFESVAPDALLQIVNQDALRMHLVDHDYFDRDSLRVWMNAKIELEKVPGCRIRGVYVDGSLAGWCGLQPDDSGVELAIVLSQPFWGAGISIFRSMMGWARDLGHEEVLFHLLESRPEYRSLNRLADRVVKTELMGRRFTTYYFTVDQFDQHSD